MCTIKCSAKDMAPENSETTMLISKSIVLLLSLIVYTSPVCADEPSELYQLALSDAKSDQPANAPRLSDVLRWKDSLPDRLSPNPATDQADSSRLAAFASSPPAGISLVIRKRQFCNSYGCNNGGKRAIQAPLENNLEPSQDANQKM
ncbi:unnamed protein product [Candidula unifasciata]|uniref:Uncharacterized protein n=1 Tax=Candidula unifasciata TaxID=100452 RepID=A0A8S3Z8L9_9EUPU|nr:unnamed protein product [Candidula unifasciata]